MYEKSDVKVVEQKQGGDCLSYTPVSAGQESFGHEQIYTAWKQSDF